MRERTVYIVNKCRTIGQYHIGTLRHVGDEDGRTRRQTEGETEVLNKS